MPPGYAAAITACSAAGARVPDIEQLYAGRPIVFPDGRQLLGQDPKFDPLLKALEPLDWQACMYVFMTYRGTVVGDVAAYFPAGVSGPTEAEMSFLAGLADHAAVAVANTRLLDQAQRAAALEERARLARELHNSVSQALFSMTLHARAAEKALDRSPAARTDPALAKAAGDIAALRELTSAALAEMRALIFEVRPDALAEAGLVTALTRQAAALTARSGITVTVPDPANGRRSRQPPRNRPTGSPWRRCTTRSSIPVPGRQASRSPTSGIPSRWPSPTTEPASIPPPSAPDTSACAPCASAPPRSVPPSTCRPGPARAPPSGCASPAANPPRAAMTEPTRVFLVDDHAVVRRGLASYLDGEDDIDVIGQADGGRSALSQLAVLANSGELPDVILMDLLMPDLDGIAATAEIKARWPEVAVLAVTSFLEEAKVRAALQAGASGYLLKDAEANEVAAAIRAIVTGRVHLAPAVAATLVTAIRAPKAAHLELTPREHEGHRAGRAGQDQPADRHPARRHRTDRPHPRVQHPGQTRADQPDPGRDVGRPRRTGPAILSTRL